MQGCRPNDNKSYTEAYRLMKAVAMDTTSYVAVMTHIVNQTYWSERKYHLRIHGKDA